MDNKNTDNATQLEAKVQAKSKKKEKTIIITSAVFMLAALTLTGIYMTNNQKPQDPIAENIPGLEESVPENLVQVPDLEPGDFQVVDSGTVENPGRTGNTVQTDPLSEQIKKPATDSSNTLITDNVEGSTGISANPSMEEAPELLEEIPDLEEPLLEVPEAMSLNFTGINMLWPISMENEILIPYSMDQAVYFKTLDQYKYNPAMIIAADPGTPVVAVSAGRVTDKYWDSETGWTYEMDLGGGFKAYYGQLDGGSLQKSEDTYVAAGDVLGYVTSPTIYYGQEGNNLYFAMTKDGRPVYPMDYVGE